MVSDVADAEQDHTNKDGSHLTSNNGEMEAHREEKDSEDEDEEEGEPRLKYTSLTKHLKPVYRNGDATSAFLVAGDKMVRTTTSETFWALQWAQMLLLRGTR